MHQDSQLETEPIGLALKTYKLTNINKLFNQSLSTKLNKILFPYSILLPS